MCVVVVVVVLVAVDVVVDVVVVVVVDVVVVLHDHKYDECLLLCNVWPQLELMIVSKSMLFRSSFANVLFVSHCSLFLVL